MDPRTGAAEARNEAPRRARPTGRDMAFWAGLQINWQTWFSCFLVLNLSSTASRGVLVREGGVIPDDGFRRTGI